MAPQHQPQAAAAVESAPKYIDPSTSTPSKASLLNPCGQFKSKILRNFSLGTAIPPCPRPINDKVARQLLQTRKPHLVTVRNPPTRLRRRESEKRTGERIVIVIPDSREDQDMPSSCKDIRMLLLLSNYLYYEYTTLTIRQAQHSHNVSKNQTVSWFIVTHQQIVSVLPSSKRCLLNVNN